MRREIRLLFVGAVSVALLSAAVLALYLNPVAAPESSVTLNDADPLTLARVAVTNAHGSWGVKAADGGFEVADIPAMLVDREDLIGLLVDCGDMQALQVVAEAPDDLVQYGLAEPTALVEIDNGDGSELTVLVGDIERVSGNRYVQVVNAPNVYLVDADRCARFLLPIEAYVEDQVTPDLALSSPLSALLDVTLEGGLLAEPITIQAVATGDPEVVRTALSFGAATHVVRGRGVYELDQTYAVEMLGGLLGIVAEGVVGYGLTADQIVAMGLDVPTMRVTFDLRNGLDVPVERYELSIFDREEGCYATRDGLGVVYQIAEPAFLRIEYGKMPVRWFLSPLLIDVAGIEIASRGETYVLAVAGDSAAETTVTLDAAPFDIDRFRKLYRLLTSAAHDGALLDRAVPSGEPLLRVTYTYRDQEKAPDVMTLYAGDARRVTVEVNGVTEIAMREMYLTRVEEALDILLTDQPIETDW